MPPFFFFFNWDSPHIRLNSHYEAWSYEKKKQKKDYSIQEICLERTCSQKMSVNSRLEAIQIIGQRKAFYRQRIPESSCARKETVDIDILVTSRNGDKKIMHAVYQNNKQTYLEKKEIEAVEPVLKNICQRNTYTKELGWPHFDDEPRV